jgi:hypothetical protein
VRLAQLTVSCRSEKQDTLRHDLLWRLLFLQARRLDIQIDRRAIVGGILSSAVCRRPELASLKVFESFTRARLERDFCLWWLAACVALSWPGLVWAGGRWRI